MYIKAIQITKAAPRSINVLWAKPVEGRGYVLYIFNNGAWQPLKIVDDKNTALVGDDEVINASEGTGLISTEDRETLDMLSGVQVFDEMDADSFIENLLG